MSMIEKVMAAIASEDGASIGDHRRMAIAAIEAMREPTPGMVQNTCSGYPLDVWRAMIDAALEGDRT